MHVTFKIIKSDKIREIDFFLGHHLLQECLQHEMTPYIIIYMVYGIKDYLDLPRKIEQNVRLFVGPHLLSTVNLGKKD